jgi:hypothetical protein
MLKLRTVPESSRLAPPSERTSPATLPLPIAGPHNTPVIRQKNDPRPDSVLNALTRAKAARNALRFTDALPSAFGSLT